jgi:hypothetical protein
MRWCGGGSGVRCESVQVLRRDDDDYFTILVKHLFRHQFPGLWRDIATFAANLGGMMKLFSMFWFINNFFPKECGGYHYSQVRTEILVSMTVSSFKRTI